MKVMRTLSIVFVLFAFPAQAHFPSKCADTLRFLGEEGALDPQVQYSKRAKEAAKEFLVTPTTQTLRNWAVYSQSYHLQMEKGTLPLVQKLLKCIAANASASTAAAAPSKHLIPMCGAEMAKAKFEARFCPSPWVEIWSGEFVGKYRQVWHCAATNSQFGTLSAGRKGACGSAWLPKGYSKVRR